MSDPNHPKEEKPYRRAYRCARNKYQQYAAHGWTTIESIRHHCRTQRQKYGGWEQEKKLLEIAAVVLILSYTAIQGCQLWVIRDQEVRQLRAYVFVNFTVISNFGLAGPIITADVGFKNYGQTPAYKLKGWAGIKGESFPFNGKFEAFEHPTPTVIGPSGTFSYHLPLKVRLNEEENTFIRQGNGALYVWGEVEYRDAFGYMCLTKFRYYFGGDLGVPQDGHMATAPEGNDAGCQ